jgi:hypothetical protein
LVRQRLLDQVLKGDGRKKVGLCFETEVNQVNVRIAAGRAKPETRRQRMTRVTSLWASYRCSILSGKAWEEREDGGVNSPEKGHHVRVKLS